MARNFDIGTLRSFITVVELAGVTRAANKLHLTQSTVSMQLKRLEELVGLSLLTRNYSGMCTTPDGEHFLSYARRLVELNDEALGRLPQRAEGGVVRFGVSPDIVEPHVRRILKQFVQAYPRVSVRLFCKHSVKLLERFNAGKLDVIITTEKSSSTACTVLLERDLVWTGAIDGKAWRLDPLPLTFTRICMFRKTSIFMFRALSKSTMWTIDCPNCRVISSIFIKPTRARQTMSLLTRLPNWLKTRLCLNLKMIQRRIDALLIEPQKFNLQPVVMRLLVGYCLCWARPRLQPV